MKDKYGVIIFFVIEILIIVILGGHLYKELQNRAAIRADWNNKVNNCIMNNDYRNDCKLIIYKDKQIRNKRTMITTGGDLVFDIGE